MDSAGSKGPRSHSDLGREYEPEAKKRDQMREQSIGASEDVEANVIGSHKHTLSAKATDGEEASQCSGNDPIPSPEDAEDVLREGNKTHEQPKGMYLNSSGDENTSDTDTTETRTFHNHHAEKRMETEGTQTQPVPASSAIVKTVKTDKKQLLDKLRTYRKANKLLTEENEDLEQQIEDLKEQRGECEARFQEAQEDALALMRKDVLDTLADDMIQDELKSIFAMCRRQRSQTNK